MSKNISFAYSAQPQKEQSEHPKTCAKKNILNIPRYMYFHNTKNRNKNKKKQKNLIIALLQCAEFTINSQSSVAMPNEPNYTFPDKSLETSKVTGTKRH